MGKILFYMAELHNETGFQNFVCFGFRIPSPRKNNKTKSVKMQEMLSRGHMVGFF